MSTQKATKNIEQKFSLELAIGFSNFCTEQAREKGFSLFDIKNNIKSSWESLPSEKKKLYSKFATDFTK